MFANLPTSRVNQIAANAHDATLLLVFRSKHLRFAPLPFFAFLLLITMSANAAAAEKNVLLFYGDKSTGAAAAYSEIMKSDLAAGSADDITFFEERMDLWQFQGDGYLTLLTDFYRNKYRGHKFDLIISQSPTALNFLLNQGDTLFPGTPIVFAFTDSARFKGTTPGLKPNITGAPWNVSPAATLDAALQMQPDIQRVAVIGGTSDNDLVYLEKARKEFLRFEGRVEFEYLTNLKMEALERKLASLPDHTIAVFLSLSRDGAGHVFSNLEAMTQIARVSRVPIYVLVDRYIEAGGVGGFVVSAEAEAKEVAQIGLRILAGEKPADIPMSVSNTNRYVFDWRQLKRWGIEEQRLPAGSILLFRELSFWQQYKWRIVAAILLSSLQALLIVGLLISRIRHRRTKEIRERLAAIVESSDDAILSKSLEGTITGWNTGAERMYGYSAAEVVGKHISILAPVELKEELSGILERVRRGESVRHLETKRVTRDGRRIDISLTASPIKDRDGKVIGASIISRDITDRKRADELRRDSEDRFRMLADTAPVMVWVSGPDALCTFFNSQWLTFTGRTMEQEVGNGWAEGVHAEDFPSCMDTYVSSFNARRTYTMEYRLKRADGRYRWLVATGVPLFGPNGEFTGYVGTCVDISERKQNEEDLQHLTARLLTLQDEERQRVAAELHDGLGQSLAIIRNRAQMGLRDQSNLDRAMEQLQEISITASAAILEVREIAHNLRPYELDRLGLGEAIESMVERVSNSTSINLSADLKGIEDLLSHEAETSVYRIVQEALNNVIKHSNATIARIEIRTSGKKMTITVQDNGKGIPRQVSTGNVKNALGFGLAGIAERVRGLGGTFEIESQLESGTTLTIRLEANGVGRK